MWVVGVRLVVCSVVKKCFGVLMLVVVSMCLFVNCDSGWCSVGWLRCYVVFGVSVSV